MAMFAPRGRGGSKPHRRTGAGRGGARATGTRMQWGHQTEDRRYEVGMSREYEDPGRYVLMIFLITIFLGFPVWGPQSSTFCLRAGPGLS